MVRQLLDRRFEETEKRLETEQRLKDDVERLERENAQLTFDLAAERERAIRAAEMTADLDRTLHSAEEISERLQTDLASERETSARTTEELRAERDRALQLQTELAAERVRAIPGWRYSVAVAIAVVALVLAIAFFAQRQLAMSSASRALVAATIAKAEAGLGQPSPRVGAILTLDAYRQGTGSAREGPLKATLLSALLRDNEFAHAVTPAWSMGTFVDRGKMFVTSNRSGDALTIVWPSAGRSATQRLGFQPEFMCGFRGAPEVAAGDASGIRLYAYSSDSGTRVKVTSRILHSGSQITALACMPQADTIAVAEAGGNLSIVDVARGRRTTIAAASDRPVGSIVASSSGRFIAAIAPAMQSFTLYRTTAGSPALGTRRLRDPGCYTCTGRVAFDATDSRLAWIDGTRVEIGRVSAIAAGSEGYDCDFCRTDAILAWSAQDGLPKILLPGALAQFDAVTRKFRAHSAYALPRGFVTLPVFDPDSPGLDPHVATQEADGVAFRSLADGRPPMVGIKVQCALQDSYAVMRSSLLLGGRTLWSTRFDSSSQGTLGCAPSDPILGDSGDGEHAVWLDTESGVLTLLRVVDQGLPSADAQRMSTFVLPQELHGESRDAYQVAYDPQKRVISVASSWGVQQYSAEGRRYGGLTRSRLDELAGGGHSDCPLRLSPRGTYVFVPSSKARCQADASGTSAQSIPGTLVTTSGVRIKNGVFTDLWHISQDDRFAFGTGGTSGTIVYRLPSMEGVSLANASVSDRLMQIASDGRTLAYQTDERRIQLFDIDRQTAIASELPLPPHFDALLGLRFSPDGKHLVASYRATDGNWLVAAYDLDPAYWQQQLCAQTKDLTPLEKRKIGQVLLAASANTAESLETAAGDAAFKNVCPPR